MSGARYPRRRPGEHRSEITVTLDVTRAVDAARALIFAAAILEATPPEAMLAAAAAARATSARLYEDVARTLLVAVDRFDEERAAERDGRML